MKNINIYLAISLIVVALITGMAFGYYVTPTYFQTMNTKDEMGFGQADRFIDLRYIDKMAAHHKGAILLAKDIADKTKRSEIKALAKDIQVSEPKLIDELYSWKKQWFNDGRTARDPMVPELGQADDKTDLRFLNALISHHEDGINMAKEIKLKSSRKEIIDNAYGVEQFLNKSLDMLKSWREKWYGIK